MILSDLPTPAEALIHAIRIIPRLRADGKPVPTAHRVRGMLFGIMRDPLDPAAD
jgi:hypothetical protein